MYIMMSYWTSTSVTVLPLFLLIILHSSEISSGDRYSDIESNCTKAQFEFAHRTAEFTNCAIINARPIRLCELCASNYTDVIETYEEIFKQTDQDGIPCKLKLINVDRLQILENGYMYVQNLWQNGHCNSCYENNGTVVGQLSNATLTFLDLVHNVTTCISNHQVNQTEKYEHCVCSDCSDSYGAMNALYENLKVTQGDGNVCVDIIDSVNITRAMWSQVLGCNKKERKFESKLIAAIIGVGVLPIIFYVTTMYFTRQTGTHLTQQKRLVQTFSSHAPSTSH